MSLLLFLMLMLLLMLRKELFTGFQLAITVWLKVVGLQKISCQYCMWIFLTVCVLLVGTMYKFSREHGELHVYTLVWEANLVLLARDLMIRMVLSQYTIYDNLTI